MRALVSETLLLEKTGRQLMCGGATSGI